MIPRKFRVHPFTFTPPAGEPYTAAGWAERGEDVSLDLGDDRVPGYRLFIDLDVQVEPGAEVSFLGRVATVIKIIDHDDAGATGLSHREVHVVLVSDVAEARAHHRALMTAEGVVERDTGQTVYDPEQHKNVHVWEQVYAGPCRVQPASTSSGDVGDLAGQQINSLTVAGTFPLEVVAPKAGDRLTITTSDDPGQVGRSYNLLAVQASSLPVVRRFVGIDNQDRP